MKTWLLALLASAAPAWAAEEVSVLSTMNVPMSRYGMTWQSAQLRIRVQNLAYDKSVQVVFTDSTGTVSTAAATYVGPADANAEIWETFGNVSGNGAATFHVEYTVNGQTYRTEEQGLAVGPILSAAQNIQQLPAAKQFYGNYANFSVAVRNLAWHKTVQAHYSCDDFQTQATVALSFQPYFTYGYGTILSPTPAGFEMWSSGSIQVPATCMILRAYFTYEVDGQHFADTNFGSNYAMFRN